MLTRCSAAQAISAGSTPIAGTSPLLEISESHSLEMRSANFRGDAERVGAHVDRGSRIADTDEDPVDVQSIDELPYGCDYCNKTFVDQKKLDVGTRYIKSVFTC
jgi:hypothetical protein